MSASFSRTELLVAVIARLLEGLPACGGGRVVAYSRRGGAAGA